MSKIHNHTQHDINNIKFMNEFYIDRNSPRFCERFPSVVSCVITYHREVALAVPLSDNTTNKINSIDIHTHSSHITIDCLNPDCTKGVFDLTNDIAMMVKNSQCLIKGEKICDGFQDAERNGTYHCRCKLKYIIELQYKN